MSLTHCWFTKLKVLILPSRVISHRAIHVCTCFPPSSHNWRLTGRLRTSAGLQITMTFDLQRGRAAGVRGHTDGEFSGFCWLLPRLRRTLLLLLDEKLEVLVLTAWFSRCRRCRRRGPGSNSRGGGRRRGPVEAMVLIPRPGHALRQLHNVCIYGLSPIRLTGVNNGVRRDTAGGRGGVRRSTDTALTLRLLVPKVRSSLLVDFL